MEVLSKSSFRQEKKKKCHSECECLFFNIIKLISHVVMVCSVSVNKTWKLNGSHNILKVRESVIQYWKRKKIHKLWITRSLSISLFLLYIVQDSQHSLCLNSSPHNDFSFQFDCVVNVVVACKQCIKQFILMGFTENHAALFPSLSTTSFKSEKKYR